MNCFNTAQLRQIEFGLGEMVDVNIYANPKFNSSQMEQLLLGLRQRLDVSIYTDTRLSWRQMGQSTIGICNFPYYYSHNIVFCMFRKK